MQAANGTIISSKEVYQELVDGDDELSDWAKERKNSPIFIEPNEGVQKIFKEIADYVSQHYLPQYARFFLSKADPWVIAQARFENCIVVTHETVVAEDSKKIKIPNICNRFNVKCVGPYHMLRILKARF